MKIETFVLAWNEERLIEQFVDWYKFSDRITVLDNHSTDNTTSIAKRLGCSIISYGTHQQDNRLMTQVKEECWKQSDADWVIVCDMDEFIYHPCLLDVLQKTSATVVKCVGYQMVSEQTAPVVQIKYGAREINNDKCLCFKPKAIQAMNWLHGCHLCDPVGDVRFLENTIKLLHFNYVGKDSFKRRWHQYAERMSDWDKQVGAGKHYLFPEDQMNAEFDKYLSRVEKVW